MLNAINGIAYIVDREGIIHFAGGSEWDSFSSDNAAFLPASDLNGFNLFDLIEGSAVRKAHKAIHERVLSGRANLTFEYRCDAPDRERLMRMALGPIVVSGAVAAVLYHSTMVSTLSRVPLDYLANDAALRRYRALAQLPVVTVCAWCADVSIAAEQWFKPDEYYRRGGVADVQLSHAICPSCADQVVAPLVT